MNDHEGIKGRLYEACVQFVARRITNAERAVAEAQEAANQESKSSAGDKHEVGRAMMQIEIERATVQLHEAATLQKVLAQVDLNIKSEQVALGSLVHTSSGLFYMAIAAGKIELSGVIYYAVSALSPIGKRLLGKNSGESFELNSHTTQVIEVS